MNLTARRTDNDGGLMKVREGDELAELRGLNNGISFDQLTPCDGRISRR